jgi:hypothetical protein
MAKPLKDIVKKGVKSSKTSAENLGGLTPKAGDEKKFVAKHSVEKHEDRAGNGEAVFKGSTKEAPYNKQKDDVYEGKEEDASCNNTPKGKSCPVHGLAECSSMKPIKEAAKTGNEGHGYHGQAYNAASGDNKMAAADKAYSSAHATVKKHAADHLKDVKNPNKMVTHYLDSKLGRHLHGNENDAGYVKKDFGRFKKTYKPEMHEEVDQGDKPPFAGPYDKKEDQKAKDKNVAKNAARKSMKQMTKEEVIDEVLTKSTSAGETIDDFVHSKNKMFSGDSKKQRIKRALGAYYSKQNEEVSEIVEVNHRDYGAKGKMHPDIAKNMKVGQHVDFYSHGTGNKQYGMVTKNSGTAVHIKADKKTHFAQNEVDSTILHDHMETPNQHDRAC